MTLWIPAGKRHSTGIGAELLLHMKPRTDGSFQLQTDSNSQNWIVCYLFFLTSVKVTTGTGKHYPSSRYFSSTLPTRTFAATTSVTGPYLGSSLPGKMPTLPGPLKTWHFLLSLGSARHAQHPLPGYRSSSLFECPVSQKAPTQAVHIYVSSPFLNVCTVPSSC